MSAREKTPRGCYARATLYGLLFLSSLIVGLNSTDTFTQNAEAAFMCWWLAAALLAIRKGERLENEEAR